MVLIAANDERWTQDERIGFYLDGLTAVDPDTNAQLYASNGRRRSGRGTRYICVYPTGETRLGYLGTKNPRPVPVRRKAFTVTAQNNAAAIEQANKALKRFMSKKPRWDDAEYNWRFDQ